MGGQQDGSGVNLVGYLNSHVGIGESARRAGDALERAGVPVARFALPLPVPPVDGPPAPPLGSGPLPHPVTVLWCSPDRYGLDVDLRELRRRSPHLIGRWAWELPEIPASWCAAADLLDETWVPSGFVAQAVRRCLDTPVTVVPNPVGLPSAAALDRTRWGVPDDARLVTFLLDHHSTLQRKNPLGAIAVHRRAFAAQDGVTLLIKTLNADGCPGAHRQLLDAAAGRPDVRIVDAAISGPERDALIAGSDAYLSLHRSEGFGNTIAEAMAASRPVVATAFGGHLDVFGERNGFPVSWTPSAVGPAAPPYPADGTWAEPDLEHATARLREVLADPGEAARRARKAATDIQSTHGIAAAGRALAAAVASTPPFTSG